MLVKIQSTTQNARETLEKGHRTLDPLHSFIHKLHMPKKKRYTMSNEIKEHCLGG